jgi:hypothetical protein
MYVQRVHLGPWLHRSQFSGAQRLVNRPEPVVRSLVLSSTGTPALDPARIMARFDKLDASAGSPRDVATRNARSATRLNLVA